MRLDNELSLSFTLPRPLLIVLNPTFSVHEIESEKIRGRGKKSARPEGKRNYLPAIKHPRATRRRGGKNKRKKHSLGPYGPSPADQGRTKSG